ncbi:MAG: hypothetical protein HDT18_07700 [Oscillibacter sp.]|nr:hypothetical protein [Oscillibacter sp.]
MEQISNNTCLSRWGPYGNHQFKNVSSELKTIESPSNMDGWVRVDTSPEKRMADWTPSFTDAALERSPVMADIWKDCQQQTETAVSQFLDGEIDSDALSQVFQHVYQSVTDAAQERGYPFPLWDEMMGPAALESIYGEFRRQILDVAVQRNSQEGRQYISGQIAAQRSWKYYNSNYYYKTEEAISALTERYTAMAKEAEWEDWVSVPDYKAKGLNLYYNFNTAFSNQFCTDDQFLLDPDQIPPEDFQWFYQSGGGDGRKEFVTSLAISYQDGSKAFIDYTSAEFNPADPTTGTTWATYRDENGVRHQVSADFKFQFAASDLYNVASLLHFSGNDATTQGANRFLQNLQVYPTGYFSRFSMQEKAFNTYA